MMIEELLDKLYELKSRADKSEASVSNANDALIMRAKGRISAELYDADGHVVERVDQDNLIVRDATNIILKALSGVSGKRAWKVPYYPGYMAPVRMVRPVELKSYIFGGTYYTYFNRVYEDRTWQFLLPDFPTPPVPRAYTSKSHGTTLYRIIYHDPRESLWKSQVSNSYSTLQAAVEAEQKARRYIAYGQWAEYRHDIPPESYLPSDYAGPESLGLERTDNLYTYWSSRDVEVVEAVDTSMVSNIACDYSPSFIAIGDGLEYDVNDDDASILYSAGWTREVATVESDPYWNCLYHSMRWSAQADSSVQFTFKGTKLVLYYTKVPDGAIMSVTVDGVSYDNIDCWSSLGNIEPKQSVLVVEGLADAQHTVVLAHTGTKSPGNTAPSPRITFEGYQTDGLHENLKKLYREIPAWGKTISLPEFYNTTNEPPYTFKLTRKPLPGTEKVVAGGIILSRTALGPDGQYLAPSPGQYKIDYQTGEVQLAEPAMKVAVTYEALDTFYTAYERAVVEKPLTGPDAPIYNFKDRKIVYQAEFPPGVPNYPVKVSEMALMDGSLEDPLAKAFSIVRLAQPLEKYMNLGLRVVWEITIQAEQV